MGITYKYFYFFNSCVRNIFLMESPQTTFFKKNYSYKRWLKKFVWNFFPQNDIPHESLCIQMHTTPHTIEDSFLIQAWTQKQAVKHFLISLMVAAGL